MLHAQSFDALDSAQDAAGSPARMNGAFEKNERYFCARWEEILAACFAPEREDTAPRARALVQRKEYYYAWSSLSSCIVVRLKCV